MLSCNTSENIQKGKNGISINWNYADYAWAKNVPQIIMNINKPIFKEKIYNIIDFGAINDGKTKSTEAINMAIETCSKQGGGIVIVPKGIFFTGSILLKNDVNLHLEDGSTLSFSTDPNDYLPVVECHWEGMACMNYRSFIYANNCENIAVTGNGVLEGNGAFDTWWGWSKKQLHRLPENRPKLMEYNKNQTPVKDRIFGADHYLRPNFFQLFMCKNIWLQGFTMQNSSMWGIHIVLSENITIDGISAISPLNSPNTDGCDLESSKNILIENCIFSVGDDCIAIKSGRNQDARRINTPTENVLIRNCDIQNGHGGLTVGSEVTGGARNIFMESCEMNSPNLGAMLRIKSSQVRGGKIENIFVRNMKVGQVGGPLLKIDMHYTVRKEELDGKFYLPQCEKVFLESITCEEAGSAWFMDGYEKEPIKNVFMRHTTINKVKNPIIQRNVTNFLLDNVTIYN